MEHRVLRLIPALLLVLALFLSAVLYERVPIATRFVDWLERHSIIGRRMLLLVSALLVIAGVLAFLKEANILDLSTEARYPRH